MLPAPAIFKRVIDYMEPFLTENFLSVIHLLGSDVNENKEHLANFKIDIDQIPSSFGGNKRD
jgi:hypothetical protein